MGALLPDCVRRHRGQHAHDSGQPQGAQDVRFLTQLLAFSYSRMDFKFVEILNLLRVKILEAPNFFNELRIFCQPSAICS
jgi:hypothetical protein